MNANNDTRIAHYIIKRERELYFVRKSKAVFNIKEISKIIHKKAKRIKWRPRRVQEGTIEEKKK